MTALEVLRAAREKIAAPERWTRGVYARDARGFVRDVLDEDAASWCAMGAIRAVKPTIEAHFDARGYLERVVGQSIICFNDAVGRRHADVLAAFDRAIELAEKDAAS